MAAEPSGYTITVSCTQDPEIVFNCKAKKRPGIRLVSKIDVTTDRSRSAKEFEPGGLVEITDGQLTVPDDPELEARILAIIGKKGTVVFRGGHFKTGGQIHKRVVCLLHARRSRARQRPADRRHHHSVSRRRRRPSLR